MRHESKFATWIRSGGHSTFLVPLAAARSFERKFSVVPDRLLDGIINDALAAAVARLNAYLPSGVSIDITSVNLGFVRDELRSAFSDRMSEIGVPVNPNDPIINAILSRYPEHLNGVFQVQGLQLERYVRRSQDDARVRAAHAAYDDQVFSWSEPPDGGHPGQAWNCRCTAEPILDAENIPEGAVCNILTGDRLSTVFPNADAATLAAIAREIDLRIVSGQLDNRERLVHFLAQMRQEAGSNARLEENLNYSPWGLIATFRYFRDHPDEAERYGRTDAHPADPVSIANLAYANRSGNGGADSGDGWRFRGRGLFQLTGRGNYREFTQWHDENFDEGIDFESDPDRAAEPVYAVRSAVFFWLSRDLAGLADGGLIDDVTDEITARVNRHTRTYGERRERVGSIRDGGVFDGICRFSVAQPRFEDSE